MNESQEKKEFKYQIENLKKICFEYEKGLKPLFPIHFKEEPHYEQNE